ncbi:sulfur oxidation protein SoxY [Rhizobium sp. P32RR-XVIII]|uniref:thiosulfate oxidation carrier protein SoxY n=1 Tax=Rhizobium sp. P32RR-XVIII TaxID=2726738 RepID=UPI001456834E|nr:thiosulfate oxidation carrier protein SoxY [Rhizobium sp. P32RR-XVIII]NLS07525.1 sulfur oxidation protein SoxY [Rhizobium sp. P32RR-XVIII]
MRLTRRHMVTTGAIGIGAWALSMWPRRVRAGDEILDLVEGMTGRTATESSQFRLLMPAEFSTGYTVPMDIQVDSPMTETDHLKSVRVFAPENPLIEVAQFHFSPGRCVARVSTRIRLAGPQYVVALAEMSDGRLLMAKSWISVATNGCR